MKQTYLVVFEKGAENYSGFAPDIPGCISVGDTLEEMRANFREALELYMEVVAEDNLPIPQAKTKHVTLPLEGEPDIHAEYAVEWITLDVPEYASHLTRKAA